MKNKKYILLCFFVFVVLWVYISCSDINDPTSTTDVIPYPPPEIDQIQLYSNHININIRSFVINIGDFIGYNIYLSGNLSLLRADEAIDLNTGASKATLFLSNVGTDDNNVNGTGIQVKSLTDILTNTNGLFYIAATAIGQNDTFAQINEHNGWIESLQSTVIDFHTRKTLGFTLSNYYNNPDGSGLSYANNQVFVADTPTPVNAITNALYFLLSSNSTGVFPAIVVGTNIAGVQSMGYREDFSILEELPASGYLTTGSVLPVTNGHVFAVMEGNNFYKFHVTNLSGDPSLTNNPFTISGEAAFISNMTDYRRF